jgi:hypothetical protein|tara:strand:+ start:191 stop:412 length:222 start_codon:yes stop_codon:yes gene_type:complete
MNNFNDDLESGIRSRQIRGRYVKKENHIIDVKRPFKSLKKWRDMLVEGTIISDVYSNRNITSEKSLCENCTIC